LAPLYEIVMLANGEVVLQRSDEDAEPLVRIVFSDEAKFHLEDAILDVAQVMIDAGIHAMEHLDAEDPGSADIRLSDNIYPRTLH